MTEPFIVAGDPDVEVLDDTPAADTEHNFRDGNSMVIYKAAFGDFARGALHSPQVVAVLAAKCEQMANWANANAQQNGAQYAVTVVADWPGSRRARANVWTSNFAAILDEAKYSTLLKTIAHFGGTANQ
jgi:hypothetical protein